MNDFDHDVLEKKRLARNAKYQKKGSRSKKCMLPDDYLTPAQRNKLNGPVTTYKLGEPMDWKTFKSMPPELQKEYLIKLRDQFHIGDQQIADMMGVSKVTVGNYRKLNLKIGTDGKRNRPTERQIEAFCDWIERSILPKEEPEPEPEAKEFVPLGTSLIETGPGPNAVAIDGGSFTVTGPAEDALATLFNLFKDCEKEGTFTLTFNYTKGDCA